MHGALGAGASDVIGAELQGLKTAELHSPGR
jgi:hypothetical protein